VAGEPSNIVPWHFDAHYWASCTSQNMLTAFIPFHDCDEEMGTITMVDGSHEWEEIGREDSMVKHFAERDKTDLERVLDYFPALRDKLHRAAGTLSGGEQQMVAIGRGLMARPRLLMIDEPSLGLAPKVVERVIDVARAINRDGTSILLVEQDVLVALEAADRGYVLENGRIALSGSARELQDDPAVRKAYLGV